MNYPISIAVILHSLFAFAIGAKPNVLVIGGAGFVGYHTALNLIQYGVQVIILDDFSSQLDDPFIQNHRAKNLMEKGAVIHRGDICDQYLVKYLLVNVTRVVYLAGEIHTGLPLDQISSYIIRKMQCFIGLLEAMKDFKDIFLVYGSSLTVLHRNTLSLSMYSSVFSSIKASEEEFSKVYCQKYGILSIGMRPFYAYGSWSKPNTFLYDLASSLWARKPVQVHQLDGKVVSYDITHVSDVANCIRLVLTAKPNGCGKVYNVGGGKSVSHEVIIQYLETYLNRRATKEYVEVPYQPLTADITAAKADLSYTPKVPVEKGIAEFAKWFKENQKFNRSLSMKMDNSLSKRLRKERIKKKGEGFVKRLQDIRVKYEVYARRNGIPVARFYRYKTFQFFPNVDSGQNEVTLKLSIEELKKTCGTIDECVAFNTNGGLKAMIAPQSSWNWTGEGGLYVAEIDICQAGLHNCYGNATCKSLGPAQFECGCARGWSMTEISPPTCDQTEYVEGLPLEVKGRKMFKDRLSGYYWKGTPDNEFIVYKNKKVKGDKILSYPDSNGNVEKMKKACLDTYHCDGFSTSSDVLYRDIRLIDWASSTAYVRNIQ